MADSGEGRRVCGMPEKAQLHVAMLALQFGYAGFHVVSRLALNMGISKLVFPVYRNIIALCLLVPFAYFLEKKDRPRLTLNFVVQFFFLALCGITANQGFYLLGLDNTSPTFASAIQNSVPAITFAMAAALRIEKVRLDRRDGVAKVLGTLACVAGASVITLYKGPTIFGPSSSSGDKQLMLAGPVGEMKNWTLGCVYLIGHCLSWSGWLVLQAPVLKKYPARLSVTSYTCFFGVIQFIIIAAFMERDPDAWKFHSGSELFTILYAVRVHRFWRGVRGSDLVHRPRGPGVRGGVPARADAGGGHHGVAHPGREVLPGRHHRRRAHHHRPLPRALGKERGEGAHRKGRRRRHAVRRRRGPRHHRRPEQAAHAAAPAADLHREQRLNIDPACTLQC
ncbi:unnamed protein product [Urochloa decumbens]|uniref:WAT1-related protein n=1 Tax=Urochloa decumbens TaxID=240449 RepID=A0ABC9H429_9POAL